MAGAAGGNKGEMGGEGKGSGNGTPQPAAHLPFFSPLAAHHSAKRVIVERNLPICDLRFAICGVPPHGTAQRFACADLPSSCPYNYPALRAPLLKEGEWAVQGKSYV